MANIKKVSEIDFYPMETLIKTLSLLFKKAKIEFVDLNTYGVLISKNGLDKLNVGEIYLQLYNPNTNIGECSDNKNIRIDIKIKNYGNLRFEVPLKLFDDKIFINNLSLIIGCVSPHAKSVYWIRATKKWAIRLTDDIKLNKYAFF